MRYLQPKYIMIGMPVQLEFQANIDKTAKINGMILEISKVRKDYKIVISTSIDKIQEYGLNMFNKLIYYCSAGTFNINNCSITIISNKCIITVSQPLRLVNRRASIRLPLKMKISLKSNVTVRGITKDISIGGLSFELDRKDANIRNHSIVNAVLDYYGRPINLRLKIKRVIDYQDYKTFGAELYETNSDYINICLVEQVNFMESYNEG